MSPPNCVTVNFLPTLSQNDPDVTEEALTENEQMKQNEQKSI